MQNDEFYKKLTMSAKEKDQNLYNEWSSWAAQSNDRYYIDGKIVNGEVVFFTQERTDAEITYLHKKRDVEIYLLELNLDISSPMNKKYMDYANKFIKSKRLLIQDLLPYEEFKARYNK